MQIKKKPQQGRTVSHINQLDIYRVYYSLLTVNINTQLPQCTQWDSNPYCPNWTIIKSDVHNQLCHGYLSTTEGTRTLTDKIEGLVA